MTRIDRATYERMIAEYIDNIPPSAAESDEIQPSGGLLAMLRAMRDHMRSDRYGTAIPTSDIDMLLARADAILRQGPEDR